MLSPFCKEVLLAVSVIFIIEGTVTRVEVELFMFFESMHVTVKRVFAVSALEIPEPNAVEVWFVHDGVQEVAPGAAQVSDTVSPFVT